MLTAYLLETHNGASSQVVTCATCAEPYKQGPAEDCQQITAATLRKIEQAEDRTITACELCQQPISEDHDILTTEGKHPLYGRLRHVRVYQDKRTYYSMRLGDSTAGGLTHAEGARENIAHWRREGWTK